jgi:broad specificity phosphatase PhoE
MQTTIFLARHATPDWTRRELSYHLPPGPPLTSKGEQEAESLGIYMREAGVAIIYSSPLDRCLHTAQIAASAAGAQLVTVHSLTEWQPGETYESITRRLWPAFENARRSSRSGQPAALVTHGGPIAALLLQLGMDQNTLVSHRIYDNNNPLPPAGVWQVWQDGDRKDWQTELVFTPGN